MFCARAIACCSISNTFGVVVQRVMVNERQMPHTGSCRKLHCVLMSAVTPVFLRLVFPRGVLTVMDDQVRAAHELRMSPIAGVQDRLQHSGRRVRAPKGFRERLVIGQVNNRNAVGFYAVSQASRGVV